MGDVPPIRPADEQQTNRRLIMRKTIVAALAAAACGTAFIGLDATPAAARDGALPSLQQAYPSESYTQYRRYGGGGRYYGRGYRRGYGGAAAAGVIGGLAAGAIIGGALASQEAPPPPPYAVAPAGGGDAEWIAYCSRKYRSFDPASGTFLSNDGNRYMCQ
jgi:hypothetical protein